jgi:thiol:disulfide interchange protein DsbD
MLAILLSTMLTSTHAPPPTSEQGGETSGAKGHAEVAVSTDVGWIGPAQEFHIIVAITPDTGWHTYWENSGDSGSPTEIKITAPEGYVVGKPVFPRPEIFRTVEETTFGYEKQAAIFVPMTAPASTLDGRVDFQVTTSWLACKKYCVQGKDESTLTVSVRAWEEGPLRKSKSLERWQSMLPKPLSSLEDGNVRLVGNLLKISGESLERQIGFLGIEKPGVRFIEVGMPIFNGDSFELSVPLTLDSINAEGKPLEITGLLTMGRNQTDPSYTVTLTVDNKTKPYFGRGTTQ